MKSRDEMTYMDEVLTSINSSDLSGDGASAEDVADLVNKFHGAIKALKGTPNGVKILSECLSIAEMLLDKNRKYGDSVLSPKAVFSKLSAEERILVRLDDKLARLCSSQLDDSEDTIFDIIGYLILHRVGFKKRKESRPIVGRNKGFSGV